MSIEQSLADKAAELTGRAPKKKRTTWAAPTMEDFAYGTVFAFDQTVSKTGYCLIKNGGLGHIQVFRHGKLVEPPIPDLVGFEDVLQRATWMAERIRAVIWEAQGLHPDLVVVHERPIVAGHRIESSMLGALGVSLACSSLGIKRFMIASQHTYKVLCPPEDRGVKPGITRAVARYFDHTGGRDWNQDSRDALALALTYLYDQKAT